MKKHILLAVAVVLLCLLTAGTASAAALTDGTLGDWTTDRTEPSSWSITDGTISFAVAESPTEAFYAWHGKKSSLTNADFTNYWEVESTLTLPEDPDNVDLSLWIQVDGIPTTGVAPNREDQKSVMDWSIFGYYEEGWKWFDSWAESDNWKSISATIPEAERYTLKTVYNAGTITQYINNQQVNSYSLSTHFSEEEFIDTLTAPSVLYVNSKSYGTAYTTTWTVPTVKFSEGLDYESAVGVSDVDNLKTALNREDIAGKRIILAPGTYDVTDAVTVSEVKANLYISKSLTIQAADPNNKPKITANLAGNILKQSVICIDASGVTLDGLVIETTSEYRNKAVEVCYEKDPAIPTESKTITNTVIRNCVIGNEGGVNAAVYLGQKMIGTYTLENNHLKEMLVISNGAGNAMTSGQSASVKNNELDGGVRISGTRNTGWDKFDVENLPSITGNTIGTYTDSYAGYDVFISSSSRDKTKITPAEKLRSIFKQNTFSGNAKIVNYEFTSAAGITPYASNYTSIVKGDFEVTLTGPSSLSPNVEAIYSVTTNAANIDGITYRWQIDGVTIPDFTGPSVKYTFTNTDTVNTKQYTLGVTASQGTTQVSKDQTVTVDKAKKVAGDVPAADPITPTVSGSTEKGTVEKIVFAQSDVKSGETPTATVSVLAASDQKYTDYKESIPAASSVSLVIEVTTTNLVQSSDLDAMAVLTLNVPVQEGQPLDSYKVYHKKSDGNIEPLAFVPGYPKIQDDKVVLQVLIGGFSDIIVATVSAPVPDPKPVYSSSSGNMNNAYRVLFETAGGSFVQPATGLSSGDRIAKPADPERDGYSFAGWYKDSAGTIAWIFSEDAVPGDISLYAKWVPAGSSVSSVTETAKPTAKATAAATASATVKQTAAPTTTATTAATAAPAGISPTMTQAPVPVAGLLFGLLGGCVLIRRRE